MPHARRQIREAIATAVTGLTTTAARVHQSRVYPLRAADLPCLLIATNSEEVEPLTVHAPPLLDRRLTVTVRGVAVATADLDDTLDGIAAEVETVLGNTTLGGLAKGVLLTSIEVDLDDAIEKPVGIVTLSYRVDYLTAANAPNTAL